MKAASLIVLSGISGSGKSTALNALEDVGFHCLDNLPGPLVDQYVSFLLDIPSDWMARRNLGADPKFALLVDCRDEHSVHSVMSALERLRSAGVYVQLCFFDCRDDVVVRRFQETRRPHPYLTERDLAGRGIREAVEQEREVLAKLREAAERIIDTSTLSPHELRQAMHELIGRSVPLEVNITSFGFKFGPPKDADLILDVRFLPNPHFVPELREFTGKDKSVATFVLDNPETQEFLQHSLSLLRYLLPRYAREGKRYLTIGIGCTGGKHRSVALAERLSAELNSENLPVVARHREAGRWK